MNRINNLDYLRGLAAFGIMVFHYLSWTLGEFESNTILGRIGIYGVSIFYILSGLTLSFVYQSNLKFDRKTLFNFFKKRILRIFPLLWMVNVLTILIFSLKPNWIDIILNFTGLFGVFKWSTYLATGTWSIGNELSFYLFFPFYFWLLKNSKIWSLVISLFIFVIYLYFGFILLQPDKTLSQSWHNYVNPLNQLFLFTAGVMLSHYFNSINLKPKITISIILVGVFLLFLLPAYGNTINIVTGVNRLIFTFACVLICLGFYKLDWKGPSYIHLPLKMLGDTSYSVYLLHPLLYAVVGLLNIYLKDLGFGFSETIRLILSLSFTLIVSYLVYKYFETFFVKLGRK